MSRANTARVLAPLALVVAALAVVVVLASSDALSGGSGGGSAGPATTKSAGESPASTTKTTTTPRKQTPAVYTVKSGDILTTIAEHTGVSVARILELNPDIDPQALVTGQRIKLRP